MAKRRKVKIGRIIIIVILLLAIISGSIFLYDVNKKKSEIKEFNVSDLNINEIDYSESKLLPIGLNSKEYLLIRLNDFKVLYAYGNDKPIYPASLTKVLTMDVILDICDDINETSSYTDDQWNYLVSENASMAGLYADTDYTIKELLYGLILPSGADAATALSNYANSKGYDLIDLMNKKCTELGLVNSHFTNPTGLHDDDLYTSLDDYAKIVIDALKKKEGKEILKTMYAEVKDKDYHSTLEVLEDRDDDIKVYGGKTGFTLEAGMNIMTLYEADNRSYLLILANAEGSPYVGARSNIDDVNNVMNFLYN